VLSSLDTLVMGTLRPLHGGIIGLLPPAPA
jgi:hypothetical protein